MTDIQARAAGRLLNERTAAAIVDVRPGTLSNWRVTGRHGLPWVKVGRNVRYREEDLLKWLDSRTRLTGAKS